jgi:two-component system, NtrC family, response regulator AtoC
MHILIVDDDKAICRSLQLHLEREGHVVQCWNTGQDGIASLASSLPDMAFIDLKLPDMSGIDILRMLEKDAQGSVYIMITGEQDSQSVVDAIRLGAFDYIRKPLDLGIILQVVRKAQKHLATNRITSPKRSYRPVCRPHEMVGAHPTVIEVLKQVALLSRTRVPVLINGESGTGKELVAHALHQAGCPSEPLISMNCSAIVPTLLESEMFGHAKGAFTGAESDVAGKMESAGSGIFFLDEIGDMQYDLQAKLLRVLQEREFSRVGSSKAIAFRAQVVTATNKDLQGLVEEGKFRKDLYFRLAVSTINLPPLRDRKSDLGLLVNHLIARLNEELKTTISDLSNKALGLLEAHDWPGNVRELNNVLIRAMLLAREGLVTEAHIGRVLNCTAPDEIKDDAKASLRDVEKEHILKVLSALHWNIKQAAEQLGITRITLRKKISQYELSGSSDTDAM